MASVEPVAYLAVGYPERFPERPTLETRGWLPRVPLEELKRDKPLEYERMKAEGRLEERLVELADIGDETLEIDLGERIAATRFDARDPQQGAEGRQQTVDVRALT